ncbi:nuclease-related domain-containing protein [Onishia taeanensis]
MILDVTSSEDGHEPSPVRGVSQERVVAARLAQALADDPRVQVLNDVTLSHHGKRAHIDHLVLHPHGGVLIESRSLYGELKIDRHGAWFRYALGQWVAISSPLHRLETQQTLLMSLLRANRHRLPDNAAAILGLGAWQVISVLPDSATLDCYPRASWVSVVAAEDIGLRMRRLIGPAGVLGSLLRPGGTRLKTPELRQLGQFLQAHDARCQPRTSAPALTMVDTVTGTRCSFPATLTPAFWQGVVIEDIPPIACRGCGRRHGLVDCYGRQGYVLKCNVCRVITPMNLPCCACGDTHTRVTRTGPVYRAECPRCCFERVLFVAGD